MELTGKVLLRKTNGHNYINTTMIKFQVGDIALVASHEKVSLRERLKLFTDHGMIELDIAYGFKQEWDVIEPEDKLKGQKFAITGSLANPRSFYEKLIVLFGGVFDSSVTKNTNCLIMADKNSQTTKAVKARASGIKTIDELEFCNMLK